VRFTFGDRVVLLDTVENRKFDLAGRLGEIVGVSYEDDEPNVHLAYAVMVDDYERVHSVLPDGLSADRR
jgi:hypothetical protein